jgi:hypothetical protein
MKLKTFLSIIYVNGYVDGWNGIRWVDGFILAGRKADIQGGSNMTGTDFFFKNHNCQTLTCTC